MYIHKKHEEMGDKLFHDISSLRIATFNVFSIVLPDVLIVEAVIEKQLTESEPSSL